MRKFFGRFRHHIVVFFAVVGPGFITANVDNDSGGIYTYSAAGARFGYLPLWTLLPITVALIITQEMCSRMGAVTGKGLSDLIREQFGLRITFLMMALLVLTNLTNVMAEFAGVASSLELFKVSRYISVPLAAVAVWFLVRPGRVTWPSAVRPDRVARLATLQRSGGIAHRSFGASKRVGNFAEPVAKPAHHFPKRAP